MSYDKKKIEEYLNTSKTVVLATVSPESQPELRTIGGFVTKELNIYFATGKGSNKVKHIEGNNKVGVLFQHENQEISKFLNISLIGEAEKVTTIEAFKEAFDLILTRVPHLKATEETHNIYKVVPKQIKILDFSKQNLQNRIEIITL